MKTNKSGNGGAVALGLLAGAAAGAIAGVLLAPDKGNVTRKKVADSANKLGDQVSKSYSATKTKVESWTDKVMNSKSSDLNTDRGSSSMTSESNWDDTEVNRMINDSRKTPGL